MRAPVEAVPEDSLERDQIHAATVHGLRVTVFARPAAELIALGSMVVIARLVSPAEYGRFAIAMFVASMSVLPLSGLGVALVQRQGLERAHLRAAVTIALLLGAGLVLLTLLLAWLVFLPIFGDRVALLVVVNCGVTVLAALSAVPAAILQRRLAIRTLGVIDVSNAVTVAAVSVALAAAGLQALALVLGVIAGWSMTLIQSVVRGGFPRPGADREAGRELLGVAGIQAGVSVSWVGFANIDYAVVGATLGPREAGFYTRAYMVGVVYQTKVSQVLNSIGFPMLSRARTDEDMELLRRTMVRLLTLLMFPCLAVLAITAPVLIPWVFGARWAPAVEPTQILVVGGAATLVMDTVGTVLMAGARQRALLGFGWLHFAAYGLVVLAGTRFGIVGVATAAAIDHVVFMALAYWTMMRGASEPWLARLCLDIGPATVASVAVACVTWPLVELLRHAGVAPVPLLAATGVVAASVYLVALRGLFPDSLGLLVRFGRRLLPARWAGSSADAARPQAPVGV